MKKWFVFILLLITAAATILPGYRSDDCCADEASNSSTQDSHNDCHCSPFITCGTCSGFTQSETKIEIPLPKFAKQVHHSAWIELQLSTYSSSLLQPPRIV